MTVEKLARITRVSSRFINDIEAGNFASLPGKAYVLGFTRTVSKELGLDESEILGIVKSELYENARLAPATHAPRLTRRRSIGAALARVMRLSRNRGFPKR